MAWTTPRTWSDGELVTASLLNTHVRDNLNALYRTIIRKTADESVASNTTPQNDDHLFFSIAANEIWVVDAHINFNVQGTGGNQLKIGWNTPTGCGGWMDTYYNNGAAQVTETTITNITGGANTTHNVGASLGAEQQVYMTTILVNGANAGTAQVVWAQNSSNATATILRANSYLIAQRA